MFAELMETELETKVLARRFLNLQNVNLTTDDGKREPEFHGGDDVMQLALTDEDVRLDVVLLFTAFLLLSLTIFVVVSFALNRGICAKSDEERIESDGTVLEQPPTKTLQGTPAARHVTSPPLHRSLDNPLGSARKEICPEIQPTTSASYNQHNRHEQQQHQLSSNGSSTVSLPDCVSKRDLGLLQYKDADGNSCNYRAQIWFSVTFVPAEVSHEIIVHIMKVELDVSPRDLLDLERWKETFVVAYLLPDESQQLRTKGVERTGTSVIIDQTLVFKLEQQLPPAVLLRLSAYQLNQRRLRQTLGHVIIAVDDRFDLRSSDVIVCKDLISDETLSNYNSLGEIRLSLTYDPEASRMTVTVIEARGLRQLDPQKDLCVFVQLLIGEQPQKTKRIENRKCKTSEVSNDEEAAYPSPSDHRIYKNAVQFTLPVSRLDISSVRVSTLIAADHRGHSPARDVEHGRVTLGPFMYARGDQLDHWTVVTTQPYETVTRWHRLTSANGISY